MSTKFYTSREAARILGVCPNSVRKWADNGEINCIRTKSGQRRYDVESYIEKSATSTKICYCRATSNERIPSTGSGQCLNDKLNSCEINILTQNLSKTSEVDSTLRQAQDIVSNEKVLKPFWNERCRELTSLLWLPTESDLQDLGLTSFDKSLSKTVENSWFSKKLFSRQNNNLPTTCSILSMCSQQECADSAVPRACRGEVIKSKSIKLSLTPEQNRTFKRWHDVSRWVFNQALAFIRDYETSEELGVKKPTWMDIKKMFSGRKMFRFKSKG